MIIFNYDNKLINTQSEIKISIADLRDLVNASSLQGENLQLEYEKILSDILNKNRLAKGSFGIKQ